MKNLLLGMASIGLIASCSKPVDPKPALPQSQNVVATQVGQPTGAAIEKRIGTGGGSITSADGKVTITIPAGALDGELPISMQPIENKAPAGMAGFAYRLLPHGTTFKKPAILSLKYDDRDVRGTQPEFLNLATQIQNNTWKKLSNVSLDKNAKTFKAELNHFSDYSFYTSFRLLDRKTLSDTGLLRLKTSETMEFIAIREVEWEEGLVVPEPASQVTEWAVNGKPHPAPSEHLGGFTSKPEYKPGQIDYLAPYRAPKPDTVAISAKLNLGSKGVLLLVRPVIIEDVNKTIINGKTYENAFPSAVALPATGTLSFQSMEMMPNGKIAHVTLNIAQLFSTTPGTYTFNASDKVRIGAEDEFGHEWASEKTMITGPKVYSGQVTITVSGTAPNLYITGTISGKLFGKGNTLNDAPVEVTFAVNVK